MPSKAHPQDTISQKNYGIIQATQKEHVFFPRI